MDRVEEIETAIDRLPPEDYSRLVAWLRDHEQSRWDEQMDRDSSGGKLDFLFHEAESASAAWQTGGRQEFARLLYRQYHI